MAARHNRAMATPALPRPPVCLGDTVLLADVGNSRIKLGVVADHGDGTTLPVITKRHDLASRSFRPDTLDQWLHAAAPGPAVILVASVHDAAAARLEAAIAAVSATQHRPLRQRRIVHADMPLVITVPEPHRVGIDRLAGAAAARLVKPADRPAIVVDCGTAATVNLVSAAGEFLGGAILPGPALMAKALAEGTSRLPEVAALEQGSVPAMPGRSTQEAIAAGVGWGMRGAVARLVEEAQKAFGGEPEPQVILTGGWRAAVRDAVPRAIDVADLVLSGIALAADRACGR
jgi:type III pantothenate kinase